MTLTQLKARVDEAEEGSEDLDCAIHVALFGWKLAPVGADIDGNNDSEIYTETGELIAGFAYPARGKLDPYFHLRNPHPANKRNYSQSVDAALALIEAKLPGENEGWWEVDALCDALVRAEVGGIDDNGEEWSDVKSFRGSAKTPALALCSALLAALIAKEQA